MKDLNIIIPTLNEEKNIGIMLFQLRKMYPGVSITVADDGSKDKTRDIVKTFKEVRLIDRSKERIKGITASVIDSIMSTEEKYFVVIDADFQHPLNKIKDIYTELDLYNDLVIGTRVSEIGWSFKRKVISKVAIFLGNLRLLLDFRCYRDPVSGFFGGRTKYMKRLIIKNLPNFELEGYKILFDILKYCFYDTNISYVDYDFKLRKEGESKIGKKQIKCFLKSLLK